MRNNGRYKFGKYGLIGFCITELEYEPQCFFFDAICKALQNTNYRLAVFNAFSDMFNDNKDTIGEASIYDIINYEMLEFMILYPECIKHKELVEDIIEKCHKNDVPVLLINEQREGCYSLNYDFNKSFEVIVRHVIEFHGCKCINVMAGFPNNKFSDDRVDIVRRVMKENGLELDEKRIMYGEFWDYPVGLAMDKFFESKMEMPDAIICCNDTMAIKVCSVLEQHSYKVPHDVIVTGFDGIEMEKISSPRLTTAAYEYSEITAYISKFIINLETSKPNNTYVNCNVKYSESCGCKDINLRKTNVNISDFFRESQELYNYDRYLRQMMITLTDKQDIREIVDVLKIFCMENIFICLNKSFFDYDPKNEQKADEMRVLICRHKGREYSENIGTFPADEMIPDREAVFERTNSVILIPVHFQEHSYGYLIKEPTDDLYNFDMLMRFEAQIEVAFEMMRKQEKLNRVNQTLSDLYIRDFMAKLYNRRGFYLNIQKHLKDKNECCVGVIGVDMDGLKKVNDSFGHHEGDRAIITISKALSDNAKENMVCARFGGDEFSVAVIDSSDMKADIENYVERVKSCIDEYNSKYSRVNGYKVSISVGYYFDKIEKLDDVDRLISLADNNMYLEKARHKSASDSCQ